MQEQLHSGSKSHESAARMVAIQKDLLKELKKYPSESTGLKILAANMNLSPKTLIRILKGENSPSYKTILKIYRCLLGTFSDQETILAMPKILATYVQRKHENFAVSGTKTNYSVKVDELLQNDSIFRFIYIETATGGIHKEKVGYEYGKGGLRVLEKMAEDLIVVEKSDNFFVPGPNRASLEIPSIYQLGKFLIESKFNPEKCNLRGENLIAAGFSGLNEVAYNNALTSLYKAKMEIEEIMKDPKNKGSIKAWFSCFMDTMSNDYIYDTKNEVIQ